MNKIGAIALGLAALFAANEAVAQCSLKMPAAAQASTVPAGRIDQRLLDAAVLAEVNFARCRAGRSELAPAGASLVREAERHSKWMANTGKLSHRSTVPGRSSPLDRVKAAGIKPRAGSENIGYVSRHRIDRGPFRIINASTCSFANQAGQPLPPHTYATLAHEVVAAWMASPSHKKNILAKNVTLVSTGAAFDNTGPYCGRYWFSQKFVG